MPSTVIASFTYDKQQQVLTVEFISGVSYQYIAVPEQVYEKMRSTTAKGTFLNRFIKGKYAFKKTAANRTKGV